MWDPFCTTLCKETNWSEIYPNMSHGSNWVNWIHLLLETRNWFRLHKPVHSKHMWGLFCTTLYTVTNCPKHIQTRVLGLIEGIGCICCLKLDSGFGYTIRCMHSTCGTRFAQLCAKKRNGPKQIQTWVMGPIGWIGCICCLKHKSGFGYTNRWCIHSTCGAHFAQLCA